MNDIKVGDRLEIHCYKHNGKLHRQWEEQYADRIKAIVKTKSVFSEQADQMLYQIRRFGSKMATAYSMT